MKPIIIQNPQQGIGASMHVGYGDMRNIDISSRPGVFRLNNRSVKVSSTTITGLPLWTIRNPRNTDEVWTVDEDNKVYRGTSTGDSWSLVSGNGSGAGQGIVIWKDYLFAARASTLDVYGPLSGATVTVTIASPAVFTKTAHGLAAGDPIVFSTTGTLPTGLTAGTTYYVIAAGLTANEFEVSTSVGGSAVNTSGSQSGTHTYKAWKLSWNTLDTDNDWHPMIAGQDDIVYGGAGRYIFSIQQVDGQTFTPGVVETYVFTQQALDLPSDYRVKCLEQQGINLVIGTWKGTNVNDFKVADIFFWDRTSDTFTSTVSLNDYGINAILNINNILYVLAGVEGVIYSCNGVQSTPIAQIPKSITKIDDGSGDYLETLPGALVQYKGRIFFGIGSGSATNNPGLGVWSLNITPQGNILNFEHTVSSGTDGSSDTLRIGSLLPVRNDRILIGWNDSSAMGMDKTSNTLKTTSYAGYFESALYQVGTATRKRGFSMIEFQLDQPLTTGQGVKIKFRKSAYAAWTTIGTWDYATYGAISSIAANANIADAEFIQIRGELTTGETNTSPELRFIQIS